MLYDVILPLAFDGILTYNIPDSIEENTFVGRRVLVPLGKTKIYSAILYRPHNGTMADDIIYKDIICFLDDEPIVTPQQIRFWEWMSAYYICTLGEVMKAALPIALKLESETHICINANFESASKLTSTQELLLDILSDEKEHTIEELTRRSDHKSIMPALKKLNEMGVILIEEQVKERYKPKKETWITLTQDYQNNEHLLQSLLNNLERAKKQQRLLLDVLHLKDITWSVRKDELLSLTGISPSVLRQLIDKKIFTLQDRPIVNTPDKNESFQVNNLNVHQQEALRQIHSAWQKQNIVLLHGVTGSGKTEVYIHTIIETIKQGKQVLYLVPEIALTTQLSDRLKAVFGNQLAVYHSRLSDTERVEIYRELIKENSLSSGNSASAQSRYRVILGVRSSLFLPIKNLGLIIVDEEHDSSYKQQDPAPRYHARTSSIMLAHIFSANLLLGTATPSIESYHHTLNGRYRLVELTQRHGDIQLPSIQIVNLKEQYKRKEMTGHFSDSLVNKINDEIAEKRQVIVFQNRRGYAPWVECKQCAYVPKCVNCDVSMTLHQRMGTLVCHYCGYTITIPHLCPACQQPTLSNKGFGTEKIEDEMKTLFPKANIARMDLDTTRLKNGYQRIIDDFSAHKTDILIGTQMVTKGLDFDDVSVVAVLNADSLMNQPDFRSYERAFQMLEQVSGRAGRRKSQGEVIIQTSNPENPLLAQVQAHNYKAFYEEQIEERKAFRYPPFYRLITIYIKHRDFHQVDKVAQQLQLNLQSTFNRGCSRVTQPSISRVQNMYIRNILLKLDTSVSLTQAKDLIGQHIRFIKSTPDGKSATIYADVDPV